MEICTQAAAAAAVKIKPCAAEY